MQRGPRHRRAISIVLATCLLGSLLGLATATVDGIGQDTRPASAEPVAGGLGYTALTAPCRAVDTRVAGGTLAPGGSRDFQMRGSVSFAAQGGSTSGCGLPLDARAVEVSITAVSPTGANGFVRAFPAGNGVNAAFLNYTVGRGITNTGTVGLNPALTNDLGVSNFGGTIHVIVDVQGYFAPLSGASYVPLAAPCRVVDTRNAGGTIIGGGSRAFQVAGTGGNFAAQGGTVNGCGVPDGVTGVEVSLTVIGPVGTGFTRIAPNDGSNPSAAFINYTSGTGITNTGSITLSNADPLDVIVRNFGGTVHLALDVQGFYTTAAGEGTRYQTITSCRSVDTRNAGGPLADGQTRTFQVGGDRVEFPGQGTVNPTGCGIPARAAAVEVSLTAVSPTGTGFTRPGPAGGIAAATFLNYTAVGGITNTGTIPLSLGGATDLSVTNLGGSTGYIVDVLGYYEPPAAFPRSVETIDAGLNHTCMVVGGGLVRCWGLNGAGRLGDGTTLDRATPVTVTGITGAVQVTTGNTHSCALLVDGAVRCWGNNGNGRLGNGGTTDSPTPVTVSGITDAVQITAGATHTCAALRTGAVRCWGDNTSGQIGDSTTTQRTTPVDVTGITDAIQVTAGDAHTCALRTNRAVRCWGNNGSGRLGDTTATQRNAPVAVSGLNNVAHISAGKAHTCATLLDGTARCWGNNNNGRLGDNTTTVRLTPTAVTGLTGAARITAGGAHSCATLTNGTTRCWGANAAAQIGDTTTTTRLTPATVTGLAAAVQVAAGDTHTCAVDATGNARCWGFNDFGQLGDGTTTQRTSPTTVSGLTGTVQITAGDAHTCALLADGTARCWGFNDFGQLGDGTTTQRETPAPVSGISGAVQLTAGERHTCALLVDGTARCWGYNGNGELGNGGTTDSSAPVTVSGLTGAVQITAGGGLLTLFGNTCAVLADGTARCWGANIFGQLGDSTTTRRETPTPVSSLAGAVQITAGEYHTCAVLADGTARCWGNNVDGTIGDGTTDDRTTPTPVSSLAGVVQITAGDTHTCALLADGTARCWGSNGNGMLGNGDISGSGRNTPDTVSSLAGAVQVAAGGAHTCAALADGAARCWGRNVNGQLGDGTTDNRTTATAVTGLP